MLFLCLSPTAVRQSLGGFAANLTPNLDFVGGGFNAGVPGKSEGALGGGWTLTNSTVEFGLGGVFNNQSFNVAVTGDKETGQLTVTVNGKTIPL